MTLNSETLSFLADIRAIVFDMDGVVVDSEPLHEKAQEIIFQRYGLAVPRAEFMSFKGRTENDVFSDILARFGGDHLELADVVAAKHLTFQELLAGARAVDGVVAFIRQVHGSYPLALTTSATLENQQFVFRLLSLASFFDVIVTAADVSHSKPHPDPYLTTVRRLGMNPKETLVIEDSVLGIRSALAAGCTVAGLVGTFSREALEREQPHLVFEKYSDLSRLLNEARAT